VPDLGFERRERDLLLCPEPAARERVTIDV
jgi:hypothetical protein